MNKVSLLRDLKLFSADKIEQEEEITSLREKNIYGNRLARRSLDVTIFFTFMVYVHCRHCMSHLHVQKLGQHLPILVKPSLLPRSDLIVPTYQSVSQYISRDRTGFPPNSPGDYPTPSPRHDCHDDMWVYAICAGGTTVERCGGSHAVFAVAGVVRKLDAEKGRGGCGRSAEGARGQEVQDEGRLITIASRGRDSVAIASFDEGNVT